MKTLGQVLEEQVKRLEADNKTLLEEKVKLMSRVLILKQIIEELTEREELRKEIYANEVIKGARREN